MKRLTPHFVPRAWILVVGFLTAFGTCFHSSVALAEQRVAIVVGTDAPSLERLAADELATQLQGVFEDVTVDVGTDVPQGRVRAILVGRPETNPHIRNHLGASWPDVTDQGLVIRTHIAGDRRLLTVGGGSPAAVLWAVCELGHRLGVRHLTYGDLYPNKKKPFNLEGLDAVVEPQLRSRTWRTVNDFPIGPESWGIADHKPFLRQLAKMKFNRLMLSVYPWQPFVSYEFGGVRKQTAVLWWGNRYPVDGETVGKKVFRGKKFFENPDFAGLNTTDEMTAAGQKHLEQIIQEARSLGMSVGVSISPLAFPKEFQPALPGSKIARALNGLTITPTGEQGPTDETLLKLTSTKIRAWLKTYPELDTLYLTLPEFPEWGQHAETALKLFQSNGILTSQSLDGLVKSAASRELIASGKRGEEAIRGNIVGLAFLHKLFQDRSLLHRANGSRVELVITSVDPVLYPVLDQVVPDGAATLNFVDYTARRIASNRDVLSQVPAGKVRSRLIMTLADDNVGILPQSALQSLETLATQIKSFKWDGFSTRYWIPSELDPGVYFLGRAAWDSELTARDAVLDLWTASTRNPAAAERLWLAWEHLEKATNLIDEHNIGFTFPVPGMLMKHYNAEPIPEWWQTAADAYTQYMIELYRAQGSIDGDAKPLLFYYAKRGEYVLEYLAAVKAVREAGLAKKAGNTEQVIESLETALESTYNCINTLSDVARDQSDRGVIAVLNEYAYRPLLSEYEKLIDEAGCLPDPE